MVQVASARENRLMLVGELLVLLVSLPLILLLVVLSRPLFIIAALVSMAFYAVSGSFRRWLATTIHYKGLRLDSDVALHAGHSWMRNLSRSAEIGVDDLVQAALGPVDEVALPAVGQRVLKGDRLFALRRGDRHVVVRSPIAGTVSARNESLLEQPGEVNESPFGKGWVVRLRPEGAERARHSFLRGTQAREWFRGEVDRLILSLHSEEGVEVCLADGGSLVHDLYRQIDDQTWQRLTESFFGGTGQTS